MIEFKDSEIIQILPETLAEQVEVKCLSYAIHKQIEKLMTYCKHTKVYSATDFLDDEKLDLLAIEMNVPFYDVDLSISEKRQLIKTTFAWFSTVGTPAAVESLVNTIFIDGTVIEWFESGGEPYTFSIETAIPVDQEIVEYFNRMLVRTKNVRSKLTSVDSADRANQTIYVGIGVISEPEIMISNASIT